MKPYYEHAGITIYHGDCREVLPALSAETVDFVLTDPPYNAPDIGPNHRAGVGGGLPVEEYAAFCREWFSLASAFTERLVFSCGIKHLWEYPVPRWVIAWHKPSSVSFSSLGGYNTWEPILVYGKAPSRLIHDHMTFVPMNFITEEWAQHPCPKQPKLWIKLCGFAGKPGETVLDPFLGSGTTAWAAKQLGMAAIGIEIEERYCEIAAKRLAQEVLPLNSEAEVRA